MGPRMKGMEDPFAPARRFGAEVIRRIIDAAPTTEGAARDSAYPLFYNVNFPPTPVAEVRGIRVAPQGRRRGPGFSVEPFVSPSGRRFLWVRGGPPDRPAEEGSDVALNMDGWISVTPMRADFTCHASLAPLADALDGPTRGP